MSVAALVAAFALSNAAITFRAHAQVAGGDVRLSEVADLASLPHDLQARASDLVVARLPRTPTRTTLRASVVAARARAQLPALAAYMPAPDDGVIAISISAPARRTSVAERQGCLRLTASVAAGAFPTRAQLEPVECPAGGLSPGLRYDEQARLVRASRPLKPGDTVRAVPWALVSDVAAGRSLTLEAHVGVVHVVREVETLQPGRAGKQVFVRGTDGRVFVASIEERGR